MFFKQILEGKQVLVPCSSVHQFIISLDEKYVYSVRIIRMKKEAQRKKLVRMHNNVGIIQAHMLSEKYISCHC